MYQQPLLLSLSSEPFRCCSEKNFPALLELWAGTSTNARMTSAPLPCLGCSDTRLWPREQIPSPAASRTCSLPSLPSPGPCSVHASATEVNVYLPTTPAASICYLQRKQNRFKLSGKPRIPFPWRWSSQPWAPEGASLHPCTGRNSGTSFLFLKPFIPLTLETGYVQARSCALPGSRCCLLMARTELQKENKCPSGASTGCSTGCTPQSLSQASSAAAHLGSCTAHSPQSPES